MQHSFDVHIAQKYGVHCAVLLNTIQFWVEKNKANGRNFYDGRYWTFNSAEAYSKLFPYMSKRQITYALKKLRDEGILITGRYNAQRYDQTLWYAITDYGETILQNCQIDVTPTFQGSDGNVQPIPVLYTDTNSVPFTGKRDGASPKNNNEGNSKEDSDPNGNDNGNGNDNDNDNENENEVSYHDTPPDSSTNRKAPTRHKYGQYQNVLLSDEDMNKLKTEFPGDWAKRIERLSEYIASSGKSYKNHLATIRAWARKDKEQPKQRTTGYNNRPQWRGFEAYDPNKYNTEEKPYEEHEDWEKEYYDKHGEWPNL